MPTSRPMDFQRIGRTHHLKVAAAEDLALATRLDEAHWVATGAPIGTINCDETFLRLMDADGSGRILCHEVRAAIEWLLRNLRRHEGIAKGSRALRLSAINTHEPEGQRVAESARKILDRLGLAGAKEVTLEQVRQIKATVESSSVSEAGVVLPEAAGDEELRQFLADVIATVGGAPHPSGATGVGEEQLGRFLAEAAAYLDWTGRGEIPPGAGKTDVMALGADTPAAYAVLAGIRGKIDQYFAQCEAVALDERFAQRMGWTDAELEALDFGDPTVIEDVLRKAPLAKGRPDRVLNLTAEINPYYAAALEAFRLKAAEPALGETLQVLSARQWQQIKAFFAAHKAWAESKPPDAVASLGAEKLRAYLDERFANAVRALIAESAATAFVLDNIRLTEKLILYQAYMVDFANNFVSFPHLYRANRRAMFEMGSMVMDGRRFNLAVRVENRAEHAKIARTSNMCLLYVEVTDKGGGVKVEVAVPVTHGGIGNLCVGKRGVFYDVGGEERDAKVVEIIENPISLPEAILQPFRRLGRLITGKIESLTTEAEKKLDTQAGAAMAQVAPGPAPGQPPAAAAAKPSAAGMVMGIGVAGAALSAAAAYVTKTLAQTHWLAIVIGVLAAVLLVMLPTAIVAMLKLRKRDLSAILEGSGWAINARMRLTRRQRLFFTQRPAYPKGARGVRRWPWVGLLITLAVLGVLIAGGMLAQRYLKKAAPSGQAPAVKKPAPGTPPAKGPGPTPPAGKKAAPGK